MLSNETTISFYNLDHIFKYHPPTPEQTAKYEKIRSAAKEFCQVILENTPSSQDQDQVIASIRQAVMFANASIALGGSLLGFSEEE